MSKSVLLTCQQNKLIRSCLEEYVGCDDDYASEIIIALFECADEIVLIMPDTWEVRDAN